MSDSSNFQQFPYDVRLNCKIELSSLNNWSVGIFSSNATFILRETSKDRIICVNTMSMIGNWLRACSILGGSL